MRLPIQSVFFCDSPNLNVKSVKFCCFNVLCIKRSKRTRGSRGSVSGRARWGCPGTVRWGPRGACHVAPRCRAVG